MKISAIPSMPYYVQIPSSPPSMSPSFLSISMPVYPQTTTTTTPLKNDSYDASDPSATQAS